MRRAWFTTSRLLAALSSFGIGLALASVGSPVFLRVLREGRIGIGGPASEWVATGVTSSLVVIATGWMAYLRRRRRADGGGQWGMALPVAVLIGAFLCASLSADQGMHHESFFFVAAVTLVGATAATLGLPTLLARAAARGLVWVERAEALVGFVSMATSAVGLALRIDPFTEAVAVGGMLAGAVPMLLALVRALGRNHAVAAVAAGKVAGYRMSSQDGATALVRMAPAGPGYRAAEIDVEVLPLESAELKVSEL